MKIITNVPFPSEHPSLEAYELDVTYVDRDESHVENYKAMMADYDIWIEMDPIKITREVIEAGKNLKWIHVGRVGFDGADLDAAKERGIILTNSRGCNNIPISEDVVLKMLMLSRDSYRYFTHHQQKTWKIHADQPLTGSVDKNMQILSRTAFTLLNKTIGILGTGMIGKEIAKRVKPFGMKVNGFNHSGRKVEGFDQIFNGHSLSEMLVECDYVVTAFPLTGETEGLCNRAFFKTMKKTAYFINISRGEVVNEEDLMDALDAGEIKGAAIDVAIMEPLPETSRLWETENLIITPHQAWLSETTYQNIKDIISVNLQAYLEDEDMINLIQN